jgi:hypothetical protein
LRRYLYLKPPDTGAGMNESTVPNAAQVLPNQPRKSVSMKINCALPGRSNFVLGMIALLACCLPSSAWAMEGLEEKIADVFVWIVLVVVPLAGLYLFWKVHILPEVFAEKNHHPQKHGIQVLCLLSLVFGGMLWPFAWLWAFMKPVGYKLAYGTDKHDDFFLKPGGGHADKPLDLAIVDDELMLLKEKLDGLTRQRELIVSQQSPSAAPQVKVEGQKHA